MPLIALPVKENSLLIQDSNIHWNDETQNNEETRGGKFPTAKTWF
jgi:hypothetical protein